MENVSSGIYRTSEQYKFNDISNEPFFFDLHEICPTLKVEDTFPSKPATFVPHHASSTLFFPFVAAITSNLPFSSL
jgi:hypothetical protein